MQGIKDTSVVHNESAQGQTQPGIIPSGKKVKFFVALVVFIVAIVALFVLRGGFESGNHSTELGKSQTVSVDKAGSKGKLVLTVESIKKGSINDLAQFNLKADEKNKTPFYVTFTADKKEGAFDSSDSYSFSGYKWSAKSKAGKDLAAVSLLTGAENLEGCKQYSPDDAKLLAAGDKFNACQIFFGDGDDVTEVTYKVNKDISYTWKTDK